MPWFIVRAARWADDSASGHRATDRSLTVDKGGFATSEAARRAAGACYAAELCRILEADDALAALAQIDPSLAAHLNQHPGRDEE